MERLKNYSKNRRQTASEGFPVHETFRIAGLLAVVGGFLDAYTYCLRGGVFANAQTGNMVLLAVKLASGQYRAASYYIIPIVAFAAGVFITEMVKEYFTGREFAAYERRMILAEIVLLAVVGLIPASVPDSVVNVTISFVCSLQVNSFRKFKNLPYASTMCTGNLRSGTEKLFRFLSGKEKRAGVESAHYFGIILLFIAGAAAGTALAGLWGLHSIWCCCVALTLVFAVMRF